MFIWLLDLFFRLHLKTCLNTTYCFQFYGLLWVLSLSQVCSCSKLHFFSPVVQMISGFLVSWMAPDGSASYQLIQKAINNTRTLYFCYSIFAHEDTYVWFVHISQNAEIQNFKFKLNDLQKLFLGSNDWMADNLTWQTLSKAWKVKQQKCFIIFKDSLYRRWRKPHATLNRLVWTAKLTLYPL